MDGGCDFERVTDRKEVGDSITARPYAEETHTYNAEGCL